MGLTNDKAPINSEFWAGKRVLVTGHTGFKGSWLTLWLDYLNADVCGMALPPPTDPSLFEIANLSSAIRHELADVRDYDAVEAIIRDVEPEIIFHMAAQPIVRESFTRPLETVSINAMGTLHVLEAARRVASVKTILNVTSDKCYLNDNSGSAYNESDRLGGHDLYSCSKACSELITEAYGRSFLRMQGVNYATGRAGNVIGGGDWASDRLVPDIMKALCGGDTIRIRNQFAIRPWQHVLEPLSGYLMLVERMHSGDEQLSGAWNFGPVDEIPKSVGDIVELLIEAYGGEAQWEDQMGHHPPEASILRLDVTKATEILGWVPRWTVEQALDRVVLWTKAWQEGRDIRSFCLEEIELYSSFWL